MTDEEVISLLINTINNVTKHSLERETSEDCRNCKKWDECPCGKEGHENGTSIGYSIGKCKDYMPSVTPKAEREDKK